MEDLGEPSQVETKSSPADLYQPHIPSVHADTDDVEEEEGG